MTDTRGIRSLIGVPFRFEIALPPAIADKAKNSEGSESKIDDPFVQGLGRPFAQLLRRSGTDGALGLSRSGYSKKKAQDQYNQSVLFYREIFFLQMIHNCNIESQKYNYSSIPLPLADLFGLHRFLAPLTLIFVQNHLPHTYLFGCHLDTFVLLDIFHAFFQRHLLFGNDPDGIIAAAGAHIRQLFAFRSVHDQIAWFDMFRDDLSYIYFFTRIDEKGTAILQLIDGISRGLFLVLRQQDAIAPAGDRAFPRFVFEEAVRHDGFAGGIGQHIATQTDQSAGRDLEFQVLHVALAFHDQHFSFT